jgi:hypothetical protein
MQVKVTIYKRVLLSYEIDVKVEQNFNGEALIQAVHEYAPDGAEGWEEAGAAEYDSDKHSGVPKATIKEIGGKMPYFDGLAGRIIEKP